MGGNKKMNNNFWSLCIRKIIVMVIFYFLCIMYLGCTTSTIVEIEPNETTKIIIVDADYIIHSSKNWLSTKLYSENDEWGTKIISKELAEKRSPGQIFCELWANF